METYRSIINFDGQVYKTVVGGVTTYKIVFLENFPAIGSDLAKIINGELVVISDFTITTENQSYDLEAGNLLIIDNLESKSNLVGPL